VPCNCLEPASALCEWVCSNAESRSAKDSVGSSIASGAGEGAFFGGGQGFRKSFVSHMCTLPFSHDSTMPLSGKAYPMSVFDEKRAELEQHELMMGVERGRLAVALDLLTDSLILVGQHGVYCASSRNPAKPALELAGGTGRHGRSQGVDSVGDGGAAGEKAGSRDQGSGIRGVVWCPEVHQVNAA